MLPYHFSPLNETASTAIKAATAAEPTPVQKVIQNLLAHIPTEASGFYLLALEFYETPDKANKALLFGISFGLLLLVRWLAKATVWVFATSIVAFVLWMAIFDNGYLKGKPLLGWLDGPSGPVVALAFTTVVTLLASAGKIR